MLTEQQKNRVCNLKTWNRYLVGPESSRHCHKSRIWQKRRDVWGRIVTSRQWVWWYSGTRGADSASAKNKFKNKINLWRHP